MKQKIYFRKFNDYKEAEQSEPDFWLSMKPEERVAVVDSCLLDYLRLKEKPYAYPPRLRRVCRVIKKRMQKGQK